jgi:hypothetical protein
MGAGEPRGRRFALSAASAVRGNQSHQLGYQRIEMVTHHRPDQIEAYVAVAVDEAVAHAGDVAPGNFGMSDLCGSRNLACSLADNFHRSNDRVLVSRFRSSPAFAARSEANFGIEGH